MTEAGGIPLSTPVTIRMPSPSAGLLKRVLSTLVLLPAFLAIVMAGPLWLFGATIVLIGAAGQWEFTGMFARAGIETRRLAGLVAGVALTASFALPVSALVVFTAVVLGTLTAALWRPRGARIAWEPFAITLFGVCYVNWLLGHGFWLRDLPSGKQWVLLLIWVTWLGETAAYLIGSSMGRHPLAPAISPRKTIEGAVAQLLVSVLAAVAAQAWFFTALSLGDAMIVGVLLGVVGQVGDLVESALKRSVGTKDAGELIPGHGGILDRIDSLLFNTPVLFYYASHGRMLHS
ncbi:MAG TPA: phosphatidate cytidylyltransferase [Methylomirabilota bacterium]|jgi:phosphatidate cytidylyltransferase|nr:phosphatidate cytidylyltransferase [Methylomirabilota bacterium]